MDYTIRYIIKSRIEVSREGYLTNLDVYQHSLKYKKRLCGQKPFQSKQKAMGVISKSAVHVPEEIPNFRMLLIGLFFNQKE